MNHCAIQQNAFAGREEMRREHVICPKPRRLGVWNATVNDHPIRSLRWHLSHQVELCDSKASTDLLDIILTKGGGCGMEHAPPQVASSPPFFCGSPPSRVANPLIQDARFGDEKLIPQSPLSPIPLASGSSSSSSSSARKGSCVRASFGSKPSVRIEGFDCRDRRSCSIPTLA